MNQTKSKTDAGSPEQKRKMHPSLQTKLSMEQNGRVTFPPLTPEKWLPTPLMPGKRRLPTLSFTEIAQRR